MYRLDRSGGLQRTNREKSKVKKLGILVLALFMTFSMGCASDYGVTTVQQESKQEDDDKSVYTFTDDLGSTLR